MEILVVKKLSAGSVFRLLAAGLFGGFVPLFFIAGVLAYLDLFSLTWNAQPVHGLQALWVGPLIGLLFASVFTAVMGCAMTFGLWIYAKVDGLTLEYEPES